MIEKTMFDAINDKRENLIETLIENKDFWIAEPENVYDSGFYVGRLFFEKRNDGAVPMQLVLQVPLEVKECNEKEIVKIVEDRIVKKNRSAVPSNSNIIKSKESNAKINNQILESVSNFESTLKTYKKNVLNNYLLYPENIKKQLIQNLAIKMGVSKEELKTNEFELNQFLKKDIHNVLNVATKALLLNTNEKGKSSLNKTKEITDFMLSEKGIEKIKSLFPETIDTYIKIEDGFNELFKKKESLSLVPSERKKQEIKEEDSNFSFDDFLKEHGMKEKKSPSLKR
ncbi:MAG: hypothetical protein CL760_10430 [Chloroflexi bacterium]|nr:hypothetical protein [Chloroflexota bacterium]|tara:strand:+ start:22291 stop:23145 length:855 start_codon:yes stop_codon:yes gene_type:complete